MQLAKYKDANAPLDERLSDLLPRMSIREKIAQVSCRYWGKTSAGDWDVIDANLCRESIPDGIGQICQLGKRRTLSESARMSDVVQRFCIEETRLGIPALVHEETLHGVVAKGVTSLPGPLTMASSWDPLLVEAGFRAVAAECRSGGIHVGLSPVLDVARDPRWGRFQESFGEDPLLVSEFGVATVRGLQGQALDGVIGPLSVAATGKHFIGYGHTEGGQNCAEFAGSRIDLFNVHLRPWRKAIREAGLALVMPSYSSVEGVPVHANPWLLDQVLRGDLNFGGLVVSDYGAVLELMDLHCVVHDEAGAASSAFSVGCDFDLPNSTCYEGNLQALIQAGDLCVSMLDQSVERVLALKFKLGLFDNPYSTVTASGSLMADELVTSDDLALRIAEECVVLLENRSGFLPLEVDRIDNVAVIGPHASENILGPYFGSPKNNVSYVEGIRGYLPDKVHVNSSRGCRITRRRDSAGHRVDSPEDPGKMTNESVMSDHYYDADLLDLAVEHARCADVVILVVGDNHDTTSESFRLSPVGDRCDLGLLGSQVELYERVRSVCDRVVVVLSHSGVISQASVFESCDALVDVGTPGQCAGGALARVLFGDVNPSGKLPYSVPLHAGCLPAFYAAHPSSRRGYGFIGSDVIYPFGYGLSYTKFSLVAFDLRQRHCGVEGNINVTVRIENVGERDGHEVVQLYHRDLVSSVVRPVAQLVAFRKVYVRAGKSESIDLCVDYEDIGYYGPCGEFVQEAGNHLLWATIGTDLNQRLERSFVVYGEDIT